MRVLSLYLIVSSVLPCTSAWSVPSYQQARSQQSIDASIEQPSRRSFLSAAVVVGAAFASSALQQPAFAAVVEVDGPPAVKKSDPAGTVVNLPSGVSYTVIKAGTGPVPSIGELAAIRFAAYCGDIKLDDVFDTPEPYYTRVGSGGLVKGVEAVLPLMQVGDRWKLTIPVSENDSIDAAHKLSQSEFGEESENDIIFCYPGSVVGESFNIALRYSCLSKRGLFLFRFVFRYRILFQVF
jgi:FKBP-type peptidyl-prolyl cis-trans isomerase